MKILFIAYYFPPSNAAGAARAKSMAKYLARNGDSVTVLTVPSQLYGSYTNWLPSDLLDLPLKRLEASPPLPHIDPSFKNSARIRTKLTGGVIRRALRWFSKEPESLWYWSAIEAIRSLRESFDVVIATGSPWVSFHIGQTAARELDAPLIMDYRDLWTDNPYKKDWPNRELRDESNLLSASAGVSAVSKGMIATLRARTPKNTKTYVCENGFDPDEFKSFTPSENSKFTIIYAGTLYPPKISLAPLFESLRLLLEVDSLRGKWEFRYYGSWSDVVKQQLHQFGLESHATTFGYVSRSEALEQLAGADLGVVVTSVYEKGSPADLGIVTSKIFDLLALECRILLIAPEGSEAEEFITRFGAGARFHGSQASEIAAYIGDCVNNKAASPEFHPTTDNRGCSWPEKIGGYRDFLFACIQHHRQHSRGSI
jgi:glycosyltransferase involved in cell wall biosynthesis